MLPVARERVAILVACGCLCALVASPRALAVTKIADGFATRILSDGAPANHVSRAKAGDDVVYWLQLQDLPIGRIKYRCVIKLGAETIVDEAEIAEQTESEGYSLCGLDTDSSDFEPGAYTFSVYLEADKLGEASIAIEKPSFFGKVSRYRQIKWVMTGLGALLLLGVWLYRKFTGDHAGAADLFSSKSAAKASNDPVVIGARLKDGGHAQEVAAAVAKSSDEAEELRKCGHQYQDLITQADKSKGVETGRRYLGLLLKARNDTEALKVFKECVAADSAFRPSQAEEVLPLAKSARAAGDPQLAVAALRGFDKAFPGNSLIPDVFVFTAKLMAEDLGNPDMARKILQHILQKYPGHHLAQEAKRYLQAMPQPG
jgi:TolA-binding protein